MAQHLLARGEVLDELEDHLRDEVERLTKAGHSPDEAVEVAMARLGQPGELAAEFAKVPSAAPWLPVRVAWVGGALLAASMVDAALAEARGGRALLAAGDPHGPRDAGLRGDPPGRVPRRLLLPRPPLPGLSEGQARTLRRAAFGLSGLAVALTGVGIAFGSLFCPNEKTGWAFGLDTREVGGLGILAWNVVMLAGCWLGRIRTGSGR